MAGIVEDRILELSRADPRFDRGAYTFVLDALDAAVLRLRKHARRGTDRHLSVAELLEGAREFALEQYGPLARVVLESLGIHDTKDLGEVVFNLVDKGLLNKQDSDDRAAFAQQGFDFHQAFEVEALARIRW